MYRPYATMQLGDVFTTNEGFEVVIMELNNSKNIVVRFRDLHGHTLTVDSHRLNRGTIKNPYKPWSQGVGYLGVGVYKSWENGRQTKAYRIWQRMLERCYSKSVLISNPSYYDCTVDPTWHNFQNFAQWYCKHPDYGKGYDLDKDILVRGNRVYGPDTCCLVPPELNSVFRIFTLGDNPAHGVIKPYKRYKVKYRNKHVGSYPCLEEATSAYEVAKNKHIRNIINEYLNSVQPNVRLALNNVLDSM